MQETLFDTEQTDRPYSKQNPVNKQLESRNLFYFVTLAFALLVASLNLMYGRW
nr:MAG TPA: hypothetical protein [Caudoviricetes sp.]